MVIEGKKWDKWVGFMRNNGRKEIGLSFFPSIQRQNYVEKGRVYYHLEPGPTNELLCVIGLGEKKMLVLCVMLK